MVIGGPATTTTTAVPPSNLVIVTGGVDTTSVTEAMSWTVVGMLDCLMTPMMPEAVTLGTTDPVTFPLATEEKAVGASGADVARVLRLSNPEAIARPDACPAVPAGVDFGSATVLVLLSQNGPAKAEGVTNALRIGGVAVPENPPEGFDTAVPRYLRETFAIRGMPRADETTVGAETGRGFQTVEETEYAAVLLTADSLTGRGVATAEPTAAVPVRLANRRRDA